jgi:hypothetical protein
MRIKLLIKCAFLIIFLLSCSANDDCLIADNLKQIKSFNINNNDYYLYLRISGFQEKEAFYVLYDDVPVFDECGKTDLSATSTVHVDSTKGAISKIVIYGKKLQIIYQKNNTMDQSLDSIPIEIKHR